MSLDIDFLVILAEILKKNFFDKELFNAFIETKGAKGFIDHENTMGRKIDKLDIKEEIIKLIEQDDYEDRFHFYIIKKDVHKLLEDIDYLRRNKELIIHKALERVYEIVPEDIKIRTDICLYAGGIDGGFTLNRNQVFINYGKYIGEKEEFVKILSHELYHSREIPLRYRAKVFLRFMSKKKRHAYGILGKIIEEGIACLIQHGAILNKDDITGNLTRRNLAHSKKQFEILNEILLDIKQGIPYRAKVNKLNVYSIGYLIVTTVYNDMGVLLLDNWTMGLDFRNIIKKYNEICMEKRFPCHLNHEAIGWIIGA